MEKKKENLQNFTIDSLNNWQIAQMLIDGDRFQKAKEANADMSEVVKQYNVERGIDGCVIGLYYAMAFSISAALENKELDIDLLCKIRKEALSFMQFLFNTKRYQDVDENGFFERNSVMLDIEIYDFDQLRKFLEKYQLIEGKGHPYFFGNISPTEKGAHNKTAMEIRREYMNINEPLTYDFMFNWIQTVKKTLNDEELYKMLKFERVSQLDIPTKKNLVNYEMKHYNGEIQKLRQSSENEAEKFQSFCKLSAELLFNLHTIHPFVDGNTRSTVNCLMTYAIIQNKDLIPKEYHAKNGYPLLMFENPNVFEYSANADAFVNALKRGKESYEKEDLLKNDQFMNNFRELYKTFRPSMIPMDETTINQIQLQIDKINTSEKKNQLIEQIKKDYVDSKTGKLDFIKVIDKLQEYNFNELNKKFEKFISNFSDEQNSKLKKEIDAMSKIVANESQYYITEKKYKLIEGIIKDCLNEKEEPDFKKVKDKINFIKSYEEFVIKFVQYHSDKEKDELYKKINEISSLEKKYELIEEMEKKCLYKEGPRTGQLNFEEAMDKIKEYDSKVVNLKDLELLQSDSSKKKSNKI